MSRVGRRAVQSLGYIMHRLGRIAASPVVRSAAGGAADGLRQPEHHELPVLTTLLSNLPPLPHDEGSQAALGGRAAELEEEAAEREDYVTADALRSIRLAFGPASPGPEPSGGDGSAATQELLETGFALIQGAVEPELLATLVSAYEQHAPSDAGAPTECLHLDPAFAAVREHCPPHAHPHAS